MTTVLVLKREELVKGYWIFIRFEATGVITLNPSKELKQHLLCSSSLFPTLLLDLSGIPVRSDVLVYCIAAPCFEEIHWLCF